MYLQKIESYKIIYHIKYLYEISKAEYIIIYKYL